MCTHVLLLAPITADPAAVIELANARGFRASTDLWPGESTQMGAFRVLDPEGSRCDCGTPIGAARRPAMDPRRLERESREGKRRHWSAERRRKWVEQRKAAALRPAGPAQADVASTLGRWCELANAAVRDPRVRRIGLLVREPDTRVEDLFPTESAAATIEGLLHVAKFTPTWLVPG